VQRRHHAQIPGADDIQTEYSERLDDGEPLRTKCQGHNDRSEHRNADRQWNEDEPNQAHLKVKYTNHAKSIPLKQQRGPIRPAMMRRQPPEVLLRLAENPDVLSTGDYERLAEITAEVFSKEGADTIPVALNILWALNLSGGFSESVAASALLFVGLSTATWIVSPTLGGGIASALSEGLRLEAHHLEQQGAALVTVVILGNDCWLTAVVSRTSGPGQEHVGWLARSGRSFARMSRPPKQKLHGLHGPGAVVWFSSLSL
jgi:hypothetical protein